jgi:hypothetical protein
MHFLVAFPHSVSIDGTGREKKVVAVRIGGGIVD